MSTGIGNWGNASSGGFYVNYYASKSPYITTSGIWLKTDYRPHKRLVVAILDGIRHLALVVERHVLRRRHRQPVQLPRRDEQGQQRLRRLQRHHDLRTAADRSRPVCRRRPDSATAGSTINVFTGLATWASGSSGGFYVNDYASASPYLTTSSIWLKTDYRPSINGWCRVLDGIRQPTFLVDWHLLDWRDRRSLQLYQRDE